MSAALLDDPARADVLAPAGPVPGDAPSLLDRLLRDRRGLSAGILADAHDPALVPGLVRVSVGGAAAFGLAIGLPAGLGQMALGAVKLPLVLLLASALSLPVLHVATAQAGRRLRYGQLNALVLQALATGAVTMAGLAPLIALGWLFTSVGEAGADQAWYAYRRVVLGGAAVAGVGGLVGAARLLAVLPLRAVLPWAAAFGLCALQLAWLLRPVVGMPGGPLVLLRPLEENGLVQLLRALAAVLL
jgi:hypothetical protein